MEVTLLQRERRAAPCRRCCSSLRDAVSTCHIYAVYGMTIASEMEFPELLAGSGTPDVWVRCGAVPAHLSSAPPTGLFFEADADSFLLRVEGVARYWVRAGRDIVVDVAADALDVQVRTFFLGAVLTAVLHQRGVLVLHASGVVGARGAFDVVADGELIFSKQKEQRFPEPDEIIGALRALAPTTS